MRYYLSLSGTTGVWLYYLFTDVTISLPATECIRWHSTAEVEPVGLEDSAIWDPCPCSSSYVSQVCVQPRDPMTLR